MTLRARTTESDNRGRPLVSAILAVRNEERYIRAVLKSLLLQECSNCTLEIIVVDGDSSDKTQAIVECISAEDTRVKLLLNKKKKTPFAFNLGILAAQGEYVCILGAHTTYANNYIEACLEELGVRRAGGCSGRVITRPGAGGLEALLIAWAMSHPFGTSSGSTRTRGAGFWDTIPYPLFLKSTVLEVGAYDNELHRNQDNDLNQRLRARGHKLYITDKTYCELRVSPNLRALAVYAFRTGFWNFISIKKNAASMSVRHFAPGLFAFALFTSLLAFSMAASMASVMSLWLRAPLFIVVGAYGTTAAIASLQIGFREKAPAALLLPFIFGLLHLAYGLGTLYALVRNARVPSSEHPTATTFETSG